VELFTVIDDAWGILKLKKGVLKQVKLYKRNGRVYAPHAGGYIEIRAKEYDEAYSTSHPDVRLMEFELAEFHHVREVGQNRLRFGPQIKAVA